MMKRWQYVYFAALFFFVCFFVSNKAFVSQTQNLCQLLMWGFEDGNCRRGGGGEGRGGDWTSWRAGLFSCLSPCSHSILISPLDLILPWGRGGVLVLAQILFHRSHLNDHLSHFRQRNGNIYNGLRCCRQLNMKPKCSKNPVHSPRNGSKMKIFWRCLSSTVWGICDRVLKA